MKLTKGPWEAKRFSLHQEGKSFASMCFNISVPKEECDAVFRLVSAAPELFAACEYGGLGVETIILLHNAAGMLEELGTEGARQLARGLREKGCREFEAITKAKGGSK